MSNSEQKTNIRPEILQQFLESAVNAAEKGQSQFFTPPDFGKWCAQALPKCRTTIVDLSCGNGQLLQASAIKDTRNLLGCDIDPVRTANGMSVRRIHHDTTLLYTWLKEIEFTADLFVLNPPWRLFWHRDRFKEMAESDIDAVRDAYGVHEEGTPRGTIDSTIATIMMALDLFTNSGEAVLIANNYTLERLIFAPGAPFKMLAAHIWARVIVPGNMMTEIDHSKWHDKPDANEGVTDFKTAVIYFARGHTIGHTDYNYPQVPERCYRMGGDIRNEYSVREETVTLWEAARDKAQEAAGKPQTPWNIYLHNDRITTALSFFESKSVKVNKKESERLFKLNGMSPMELVIQRAQRDELMHVTYRGGWRVQPALITAVEKAILEYNASRAPLAPLSDIQRLGYLDEQDTIECRKDLAIERLAIPYKLESEYGEHYIYAPNSDKPEVFDTLAKAQKRLKELNAPLINKPSRVEVVFTAGARYSLRTMTVSVTRRTTKPSSFTGIGEELEFTGQELAIFIANKIRDPDKEKDDELEEFCFMDGKLRDGKTKISEARQQKSARRAIYTKDPDAIPIDFTLQQLTEHFIIPAVPDVAAINPESFRASLKQLDEIEALCQPSN